MPKRMLFTVAAIALGSFTILPAGAAEIMAQKVVTEVKAAHPEITGLELAATRSEQEGCKTIATTEAKEMGEKCDKDEFTAMKTNQPFVEKEKDEFDATLPIHDAAGKIIGTVGMDFKASPGQTKETVTRQAKQIAAELEKHFTAKEKLFEPVK
ncbi:MAG: hypothetical protein LAP39_21800 [Acidobacteriia bacterium]|nr:hypothetical protein [Terriglobia bacterium]